MLRRFIFESIGIFLFAVVLALLTNFFRSDGLPLLRTQPPPPPPEGIQNNAISFQVLREKLKQPGIIILDARFPEDFVQGHIPGAKNLPYYEFVEKTSLVLKEIPVDREIITYCEGLECSNAEDLAFLLKEKGYTKVKVFEGGWEEWKENRMSVEKEGG